MMLTSPKSSSSEFCSGVAVSSSFGASASASLSVFAMTLDGLYTLRRRCASSITTRSQLVWLMSAALFRAN